MPIAQPIPSAPHTHLNGKANGHVKANVNGSSKSYPKPFIPGQGESFEEAKARYAKIIRDEDIQHWHDHGYVIIEKFLSPEELARIHKGYNKHMPDWDEYKEKEIIYKSLAGNSGRHVAHAGANSAAIRYDFPYDDDALNDLQFHPFLLAFAERIAGHDQLALSLGHIVGKYAGKGNYDQALHCDYYNNTLVSPGPSKKYLDIPMIVYLTDVTPDLGPTYVVSQQHTEPRGLAVDGFRHHTKQEFPELYEVEKPAVVPAGSVIIYSMRTFHRGSAMTAKEGHRWVQFTGYHTTNGPWMAPKDQTTKMGSNEFNRFLVRADPRQREHVGFPGVDSDYWKDGDTLESVSRRYPTLDMRPYGGGPPRSDSWENDPSRKEQ